MKKYSYMIIAEKYGYFSFDTMEGYPRFFTDYDEAYNHILQKVKIYLKTYYGIDKIRKQLDNPNRNVPGADLRYAYRKGDIVYFEIYGSSNDRLKFQIYDLDKFNIEVYDKNE